VRDVDGCWLWAFVYYYNGVPLSALMTKALASDNFLFIWFRILHSFYFCAKLYVFHYTFCIKNYTNGIMENIQIVAGTQVMGGGGTYCLQCDVELAAVTRWLLSVMGPCKFLVNTAFQKILCQINQLYCIRTDYMKTVYT
jgi:hypothetical protein